MKWNATEDSKEDVLISPFLLERERVYYNFALRVYLCRGERK
jgi:hypothetical protein